MFDSRSLEEKPCGGSNCAPSQDTSKGRGRGDQIYQDEADAFDGMDRKAAEIAMYKMGIRGIWWLLESHDSK